MENTNKRRGQRVAWSLVLPTGERNAISGEELRRRLGFKDSRSVRLAVMDARMNGVPVLSLQRSEESGGGYFMADQDKPEELAHTVAELRKRAFSSLKQAAVLEKWSADHTGKKSGLEQLTIEQFLKEEERRV